MPDNVLVFHGSYRSTRVGIHLANFVVTELQARGAAAEMIDALAVGPIDQTFDARADLLGEAGRLTQGAFRRVADDLAWWALGLAR